MYKSPVDVYTSTFIPINIVKQQEEVVYQAVINAGISVDKEELLRALQYDREQYKIGYKDGKADAVVHGEWITKSYPVTCSVCGGAAPTDYEDCNRYEAWLTKYCPHCGAFMGGKSSIPRAE